MDISISEITQFMRCRRKWDITSPNRSALRPISLPRAVLSMGTFIHNGIAAHTAGKNYKDEMFSAYTDEYNKFLDAYIAAVGVSPDFTELEDFQNQYRQSVQVVERYLHRYGQTPTGDNEILYTEQTFRVPIPDTDHFLVGTFDRVMRSVRGDIVIGEIKTYDRRPNHESLLYRPQFVAYSWAVGQLMGTNIPAAYVLYDGISRKLPKEPATLKNGSLSKAWSDSLSYESYLKAIDNNNLNVEDYSDILQRLQNRDDDPFYARYIIPITQGQVESFVAQISSVAAEMELMGEPSSEWVYPNFQMTCPWDCNVQNLCSAMQNKEDVQSIITSGYTHNKGNQTFQSRDGDEVEFSS